jgi:hypothetical protein
MIRSTLLLALAFAFAFVLASCQSSSNQSSYDPGTGYAGESAAPAPAPERRRPFSKLPHRDAAYIGKSLQEAEGLAQSRGLTTRVIMNDGVVQPSTIDVNLNRVNFKVKGGYVRAVARG